jgi:hypothetical protein
VNPSWSFKGLAIGALTLPERIRLTQKIGRAAGPASGGAVKLSGKPGGKTAENQLIFWRKPVDYPAQAGSPARFTSRPGQQEEPESL